MQEKKLGEEETQSNNGAKKESGEKREKKGSLKELDMKN